MAERAGLVVCFRTADVTASDVTQTEVHRVVAGTADLQCRQHLAVDDRALVALCTVADILRVLDLSNGKAGGSHRICFPLCQFFTHVNLMDERGKVAGTGCILWCMARHASFGVGTRTKVTAGVVAAREAILKLHVAGVTRGHRDVVTGKGRIASAVFQDRAHTRCCRLEVINQVGAARVGELRKDSTG